MYKSLVILSLLIFLFAPLAVGQAAPASQPAPAPLFADGYALVDAVNQLRAANGLPPYQPNTALMISAQIHSEYQAALGTWSHEGAGGTDEAQRAAAQGYGGSGTYFCDENVGYGHQFTVQQAVDLWMDPVHLGIMLSSRYVDAGGGVAVDGTGRVYFTLDVCVIPGGSAPVVEPNISASTVEPLYTFQTATPGADGAIYHEVQPGESLSSIADGYDIPFQELLTLNNYTQDAVIYPGQKLLIRVAPPPSETPTPSYTPTPDIPTATRRPTRTATPSPAAAQAATAQPTLTPSQMPEPAALQAVSSLPGFMGIGLPAAILGLVSSGLLLVLVGSVLRLSKR